MSKKVILVRHGQSENNVLKINNADPNVIFNLTEEGKEQAQRVAEQLKEEVIDMMYVSEFQRTIQTAIILNKPHKVDIRIDKRINEKKTGFEGKPYHHYDTFQVNSKDPFTSKYNDGESWEETVERTHAFLDEVLEKEFRTIVIVSHGDPLMALLIYLRGLDKKEVLNIKIPRNCEPVVFEL